MSDNHSRERFRRKDTPASCTFCKEPIARPASMHGDTASLDASGGRCDCGAVYIVDETGKQGGQALLDGLTIACAGDTSLAMRLRPRLDYQMESFAYNRRLHSFEPRQPRKAFGQPRIWFFRLERQRDAS